MVQKKFPKLTNPTTTTISKLLERKDKIFKWEKFLFLTILVLFPSSVAKRFELPFAYIHGVLVDYLLPTVYLTEVLVLLLLFLTITRLAVSRDMKLKKFLPLSLLLVLVPSIFAGENIFSSVLRFTELLLWASFALWIRENINWERNRREIIGALSLGIGWVSLLALAQFVRQRSILGRWSMG